MLAKGSAIFCGNSASGWVRWMVTVPEAGSPATPPCNMQVAGIRRQASAPAITAYQLPTLGPETRNMRRNEATTSATVISRPSEKRTPRRRWKT